MPKEPRNVNVGPSAELIFVFFREPQILGNGEIAAKYITLDEARTWIVDLETEIRRINAKRDK